MGPVCRDEFLVVLRGVSAMNTAQTTSVNQVALTRAS